MRLDPFTLLFAVVITSALAGAQMLWAWRINRQIPALAIWGISYLLGSVASVLVAARDVAPNFLSIDIANALLCTAFGLCLAASRNLAGRTTPWWVVVAGGAIWLIACRIPAFYADYDARIVLGSVLTAAYCFAAAYELHRIKTPLVSKTAAAVFLALHGATFITRAIFTLAFGAAPPPNFGFPFAISMIESIVFIITMAFLITNLAKERVELIHKSAALVDPLTGIGNRRAFYEAAEEMFGNSAPAPVAVMVFDLDRFKQVNDSHGHAVGDRILQIFADTASLAIGKGDVLARLGGEEFAVMIRSGLGRATVIADAIVADFARAAETVNGMPVMATASAGIAIAGPDARSVDDAMLRADRALYRAKALGRNRAEAAPPVEGVPREAA